MGFEVSFNCSNWECYYRLNSWIAGINPICEELGKWILMKLNMGKRNNS